MDTASRRRDEDSEAVPPGAGIETAGVSLPAVHTEARYVVQAGDTLAGIAAAHGVSVLDLLEANPGVGGNLACLRGSAARKRVEQEPSASNRHLYRFLDLLRWCWHLRACFRSRPEQAECEPAWIETAQKQLDAAARRLVEDIVRRASATHDRRR